MRDFIPIGSSPCDETCAQVGQPGYAAAAQAECERYIDQLRRQFGPEPEGAALVTMSNPHEFGTYYEVVCEYDEGNEAALAYALKCESEAWPEWRDVEAES